jgi:hypothetical protein
MTPSRGKLDETFYIGEHLARSWKADRADRVASVRLAGCYRMGDGEL